MCSAYHPYTVCLPAPAPVRCACCPCGRVAAWLCAPARARVCVCACVRARVCVRACVCVGVWPCSLRSLSLLLALLAVAVVPPADCLRPPACAAVPVCACRYLVNGGLFSPPSLCGLPCLPACVLAALAPCAWPRLLPLFASFHSPIMYILRRYARLARRVVRSAHSAANFFEIVFKPLISVQLSSA